MGANQRKNYIREKDVLMVEKQKKSALNEHLLVKLLDYFL